MSRHHELHDEGPETPSTLLALRLLDDHTGLALAQRVLDVVARHFRTSPRRVLERPREQAGDAVLWVTAVVLSDRGLKLRRISQALHLDRTAVQHAIKRVRAEATLAAAAAAAHKALGPEPALAEQVK